MDGFNDILDIIFGGRSSDNQRQIKRWKGIVSRFKIVLIKMIKNVKDSLEIRQILLHWGYELKDLG